MRQRLVIGNWKMHGGLEFNRRLLSAIQLGFDETACVEAAVCVPFPYLNQVQTILSGGALTWGAQNVSPYAKGAYTGEVSVSMLQDFSCRYVLVGHSERRAIFAESDTWIAEAFSALVDAGLRPVLCLGETALQHDLGQTESVVSTQLNAVIERAGVRALRHAVVAYEPVWAIGSGKAASPEQAQAVHAAIRAKIALCDTGVAETVQIIYGGSVKRENAAALFLMPDIDGALVGGSSLVADDFLAICNAANR
ncbi:MAG: triose-phosphate isomerase [Pseudomonadota bacterium]